MFVVDLLCFISIISNTMAPTTSNNNSRRSSIRGGGKRTGNVNGGILGLIDGNRPEVMMSSNKPRANIAAKFQARSSSSSSSSNSEEDDLSQVNTPLPKTVLFSKLAGSPMEDDSMEEEEMSDISGMSPNSADGASNEEESPEPKYSLKRKPLFSSKKNRKEDAYGADDESSDSDNDSSLEDKSAGGSESHPTPDTYGSTSSMEDVSISNDDDDDEEEASFASDVIESEDSDVEALEEDDEDDSDDEYVIEEDSASDTDDENLDSDIELEVPKTKSKRDRKQPAKKKEEVVADAEEMAATENGVQPEGPVSPGNDKKVVETDENKVDSKNSGDVSDKKKSKARSSRKQAPIASPEKAQVDDSSPDDDASENNVSVSPPQEKKQPKCQRRPRKKITLPNMKKVQKQDKAPVKSSPAETKKESIYELNRDKQLSTEDEMVVVAEVLEGTFLDDDDDEDDVVVIAEIVSDGHAEEETDDEQDDTATEMDDTVEDPNETQNTSLASQDEDTESKENPAGNEYEEEDDDADAAPFVDDGEDENAVESFVTTGDPTNANTPAPSSENISDHELNEAILQEGPDTPLPPCDEAGKEIDSPAQENPTGADIELSSHAVTSNDTETLQRDTSESAVDQDYGGDVLISFPIMNEDSPLDFASSPPQTEKILPSGKVDGKEDVPESPPVLKSSSVLPTTPKDKTTKATGSGTANVPSDEVVQPPMESLDSSIVRTKPKGQGEAEERNDEPSRRPRLRRFRSEGSIKPGKWGTGSKIGVGSFGVVRVGMNKKTGTLMAVKSITVSKAVMKDIQTEIDLLKSLDHIHIVRYLGAETDGTHLHIFQEWVPGGSVTSLLHKFGPFSMQVVRAYLFQILSGLTYLHQNHILHRDIKGGNVLVSDSGIVKLADFGSSKRLALQHQDAMENLTMRGTPYFMAPEVFEEKYGSKADIWSVGCVAFQMLTGSPPWKGMGFSNPMTLFIHIKDTEGLPSYDWPNTNDVEITRFKTMLEKCFYRDPSKRPTAKALSSDPFFTASEQSSSEDQSRGLFSPGGESVSTWGSAKSPRPTPTRSSPHVTFGKASFLSPPLPTRIHQGALRHEVISPLAPSPIVPVDASEWPSWAREKLQDRKSPYKVRPQNDGDMLPPASPSSRIMLDSLAVSEDSSAVENPFRRRNRKSGDSSLGTGSISTLDGLAFLEGKSGGESKTPTGS